MRAIVIRAARDLRIKDSSDKTPGPGDMCLRLDRAGMAVGSIAAPRLRRDSSRLRANAPSPTPPERRNTRRPAIAWASEKLTPGRLAMTVSSLSGFRRG